MSTDQPRGGSLLVGSGDHVGVHQQPVVRIADLMSAGATRREARRSVANLQRLTRGSYADTSKLTAEESHILRTGALTERIGGVVASHTSAAAIWDLPLRKLDLDVVQLSPNPGRLGNPKAGPGYHLHNRPVNEAQIEAPDGLSTTSPLLTTLDCARLVSLDWGIVIGDAALRMGLVEHDELSNAARRVRRLRGAARARALAIMCSPRSESPGESLLRLRLHRMGLDPVEQVSMPWVEGEPRVDFLVGGQLVIEFDGRSKYSLEGDPERAHWEEKRRHDRLVEAGYEVIHVVWAELWDEPALSRRVNRALRRKRGRR